MLNYEVIKDIKQSFSEKEIAKLLNQYNVFFEQEVMFDNCINPLTNHRLRFDFYIPTLNTLIEYDGVDYHKDSETRFRDKVKNDFAKKNNIRLIRVQGISNIQLLVNKLKLIMPKEEVRQTKKRFMNARMEEILNNSIKRKEQMSKNRKKWHHKFGK
jgi:hypothetical protein